MYVNLKMCECNGLSSEFVGCKTGPVYSPVDSIFIYIQVSTHNSWKWPTLYSGALIKISMNK